MFSRRGVLTTLAGTTTVVELPAEPSIGMNRRLITGIHGPDGDPLGSVWVQQGEREFADDAETLLRGGAVSAAALMVQARLSASSAEEVMTRRLFGEDGGVDGRTAGSLLQFPPTGSYTVIGFATGEAAGSAKAEDTAGVASAADDEATRGVSRGAMEFLGRRLQLHVQAYAAGGRVSLVGHRAYVLVPEDGDTGGSRLIGWVEQLLRRFDGDETVSTRRVRAAVATPVDGLDAVAAARCEVDRVLDSPAVHRQRVTSLTKSRTTVLLGEIFLLLSMRPELEDPRLTVVREYDETHGTSLIESLVAYLHAGMNVRDAARALTVHPNTLRYRIERAEQLSGLDLQDAGDRLLTTLQLELQR